MDEALLTDLYQLTMNAAYFDNNKEEVATFDMFIRKLPKDWGYYVVAGVDEALDYITNLRFKKDDIEYLKEKQLFNDEFLKQLEGFRFEGDVHAVKEGTIMAPNAPIMRITAKRPQAQFIETAVLNMVNYQTMIATKANRVILAAAKGNAVVADFGLRRAQGPDAAVNGARAAYLAGAIGTSNVLAGKKHGIPIVGTHAHSFVMSFGDELTAFRKYVKTFPNNPVLLIDTYDTINGAKNAITVAKELERQGKRLAGVRLDSGDLCDLSKKVRMMLDEQGLMYTKILASNDLNEYKIARMIDDGARIDAYGVGTEMITAKPVAAIPGVYKIVEDEEGPKIKLAPGKISYPGKKQVYRIEAENQFQYDLIGLENEDVDGQPLLEQMVRNGQRVVEKKGLADIRDYVMMQVQKMPEETKRLAAVEYQAKPTQNLCNLVDEIASRYRVNDTFFQ